MMHLPFRTKWLPSPYRFWQDLERRVDVRDAARISAHNYLGLAVILTVRSASRDIAARFETAQFLEKQSALTVSSF